MSTGQPVNSQCDLLYNGAEIHVSHGNKFSLGERSLQSHPLATIQQTKDQVAQSSSGIYCLSSISVNSQRPALGLLSLWFLDARPFAARRHVISRTVFAKAWPCYYYGIPKRRTVCCLLDGMTDLAFRPLVVFHMSAIPLIISVMLARPLIHSKSNGMFSS